MWRKIVSPIPVPLYVGIAAVRSQPAAGWRIPCGELVTKRLPTTAGQPIRLMTDTARDWTVMSARLATLIDERTGWLASG